MNKSNNENPYIEALGEEPVEEQEMKDYYWDRDEMDSLWDAYAILRDVGFEKEELEPLGNLIEKTTIYKIEQIEYMIELAKE